MPFNKSPSNPQNNGEKRKEEEGFSRIPISDNPQICLAIYIAMAHAGLVLSLAILYGIAKLLERYWHPIQWAILCSMPLRELQSALVNFWSHTLELGLFEALIAVPIAVIRTTTWAVIDSQTAVLRLLRQPYSSANPEKIGFTKLMQWLVSFGLFVFAYERMGFFAIPAFTFPVFVAHSMGFRGDRSTSGVAETLSAISNARRGGKISPRNSTLSNISRYFTSLMLNRLKTMVGIGLIVLMIVGVVFLFLFFSYKIGMEGKEAVISLKIHLQENDYAERIGLKKWMDDNHVPDLIDTYTTKFYETLSQQMDSWAEQYNATEIVHGFRHYLTKLQSSLSSKVSEEVHSDLYNEKTRRLWLKIQTREWDMIYRELSCAFGEFLSRIVWEELVEHIKGFALHSMDVSKRLFASTSKVLSVCGNLLFSAAVSIILGAAGLFNFMSQLMVFFWLLYYLITSESGGVMDHVLGLLPVSNSTRIRCAQVLDKAISSVLLASAKVALFEGCLTYVLFRFYQIHFLYMCTFLSLMTAILPVTPAWISSIPAATQLAMESRYIEAILLPIIHLVLVDCGTTAIQAEIPGQSSYLTGLSILGGMALFPSLLEGAIMGPLLITVVIALKNLYEEFLLPSTK